MFTTENLTKSFYLFHEKIEQQKNQLSELDQAIGDGDHGNNMSRGMTAVIQGIEEKQPETVPELFKVAAMNLISKVGGASGPLYGTAMLQMSKASQTTEDACQILTEGLAGIKNRGKSSEVEKTMIDLWFPAIEKMQQGELTKEDLVAFVERTKDMEAKKGRASYLGERSIGHIDPGAASSQLLFESFMEAGVFDE
ncbi:MAG TPA: dihydroxyacetone kinase subunit DhaL [Enterococcus aquimarinus]|nr:dihydroxyacetone kinase subunit DhaL [Enterococcus aquimarinus]